MKFQAGAILAIATLAVTGQSAMAGNSAAVTVFEAPAQTDTRVSLPVTRQAVGEFEIASGGIVNNTVTLDGASFGVEQFALNSQGNPLFYVRFTSGALNGRWYNIAAHDSTSLTLNKENAGDAADLAAASDGDTLVIYPHWTIDTIFPDGLAGLSFTASANPFNPGFRVLLPRDSDGTGTDVPALTTLIYLGTSNAWVTTAAQSADDFVVAPQGTMILRNTNDVDTGEADDPGTLVDESTGSLSFYAIGGAADIQVIESVPIVNAQNDTVLGANNIFPVTLASSGLDAVIDNSPSPFTPTDRLILAPEPVAGGGFDPASTQVFIRLGGLFVTTAGAPAGDVELKSGQVLIIRKDAGTPGTSVEWIVP